MVILKEIDDPDEIDNYEIRERAKRNRCSRSVQYLATVEDAEAGYLSFDDKSEIGVGVIYEIYVLPSFRRRGVGTNLLKCGEEIARVIGCERVVLEPEPFDRSIKKEILIHWYESFGYKLLANIGEMEKAF